MLKYWSMLRNDCTVSVLIQKIFLKCKHKMKKTSPESGNGMVNGANIFVAQQN